MIYWGHGWMPNNSIRARAGLDDVRIHDLRHSFASGGLLVGEGLPMIGKLLGACAAERFWAPSDTIGSGNE